MFKSSDYNLVYTDNPQHKLHLAVENSNVYEVIRLIRRGSNINAVNHNGHTPLYIAAANGYDKIVRILLYVDADKSIADKNGYIPLYIAA